MFGFLNGIKYRTAGLWLAVGILCLIISIFLFHKTEVPLVAELNFIENSNNPDILGSVIPASCESNPHFVGDCVPTVRASCHPAHYRCNAGSASSASQNSSRYTWTCLGSGSGGTNAYCSEVKINGQCNPGRNTCRAGNLASVGQNATQYTWSCNSPNGGSNASCSAWIPPAITISASPNPLGHGPNNAPADSRLTWSVSYGVSCSATGAWSGAKPFSGSQIVTQSVTTRYGLLCQGNGGTTGSNFTDIIMPSGYITASNCEIVPESPSCNSTVMWQASNFIGSPAVTRPPSGTLSSAVSGPRPFPMNPDSFVFRLDDTGSGFFRSATPSVWCNPLSVWQAGLCRTLPVVTVIASPNLIRSGEVATVNVTVQSIYDLVCTFRDGGAPQTFTHTGPGTVTYPYNTRALTSAQIVTVECTSPTYNLVTDTNEARVNVVPTVQEI